MEKGTSYFDSNKTIHRIMNEIYKKWRKSKKMNGFVILYDTTAEERKVLESILGRPFLSSFVKFKVAEFQNVLKDKIFPGREMNEVFQDYFQELNETYKIKATNYGEYIYKNNDIINNLMDRLSQSGDDSARVRDWMNHMMGQRSIWHNIIASEFEKDKDNLVLMIRNINKALTLLESRTAERIGLDELGETIANDSRYFIHSNPAGRLFLYALTFMQKRTYPRDMESKWEMYHISGITVDNMTSVAIAYGVNLFTREGEHKAYQEFIMRKEAYVITLTGLNHITKVDSRMKKVFVVEDHDVFIQLYKRAKDLDVSLMCTYGKLKAPSVILIHMLCESDCQVYYSGDIEPEGLLRLDALICDYEGKVLPWRYGVSDYEACVSESKVKESNLLKLDKINHESLKRVANQMANIKRVGLKERLTDQLWEDVIRITKE